MKTPLSKAGFFDWINKGKNMKINEKHLCYVPNSRIVVTRKGEVKMYGVDTVANTNISLKISRQRRQYNLMHLIVQKGLGKQYV